MNKQHFHSLYSLETVIEELYDDKKLIVVTHYPPTSRGCISKKYEIDNRYNCYYHNNLDRLFDSNIHTWVFGHTHTNCDYINRRVRIVSNQYLHSKGEPEYKRDKTILVRQKNKIFKCIETPPHTPTSSDLEVEDYI
jgi:hypothetical protein